MNKAHSPINWENYPKETTPINEENLNKMDRALGIIDDRVIEHEYNKLSKTDASSDIVNVEYNDDTSVFKFTKRNGNYVSADVSSVVVREGYTKEESDQRYANAIKVTYSGETIVATDSDDAKFEGLRVFGKSTQETTTGKNLFGGEVLADEIVSKFKGDKNSANKTVTYNSNNVDNIVLFDDFKENQQYTIILDGNCTSGTYANMMIAYTDGTDTGGLTFGEDGKGYHVTAKGKSVRYISGYWSNGYTTLNYEKCGIFEGVITLEDFESYTGGKPSPSVEYPQPIESVGDDGQIEHDIYYGNIVNSKKIIKNRNESVNVSDDGYAITVIGGTTTNWSDSYIDIVEFPKLKGKKLYVSIDSMSATNMSTTRVLFVVATTTGKMTYSLQEGKKEVVIPYNANDVYVSINTNYSEYPLSSQNEVVVKGIMVSMLDVPYEPYKEPQSLIASTPNGLLGIRVDEDILTTYTDDNGIKWCADEIDHARGKRVQRIEQMVLTGNDTNITIHREKNEEIYLFTIYINSKKASNLDKNFVTMSSHFMPANNSWMNMKNGTVQAYDNQLRFRCDEYQSVDELKAFLANEYSKGTPVKISYILATPIETDLSAAEIEAYRALHSNYPTTTILNDENAHMEVTLVADTKNHIEQNYVPLASYTELANRVLAIEQALA